MLESRARGGALSFRATPRDAQLRPRPLLVLELLLLLLRRAARSLGDFEIANHDVGLDLFGGQGLRGQHTDDIALDLDEAAVEEIAVDDVALARAQLAEAEPADERGAAGQ